MPFLQILAESVKVENMFAATSFAQLVCESLTRAFTKRDEVKESLLILQLFFSYVQNTGLNQFQH